MASVSMLSKYSDDGDIDHSGIEKKIENAALQYKKSMPVFQKNMAQTIEGIKFIQDEKKFGENLVVGKKITIELENALASSGDVATVIVKSGFNLERFADSVVNRRAENSALIRDTQAIAFRTVQSFDVSSFIRRRDIEIREKELEIEAMDEDELLAKLRSDGEVQSTPQRSGGKRKPKKKKGTGAETADATTDVDAMRDEYLIYERAAIKHKWDVAIVKAEDDYNNATVMKQSAEIALKGLNEKDSDLEAILTFIGIYSGHFVALMNKLKDALVARAPAEIVSRLRGTFVMPSGEQVSDPFGKNDLLGTYHLLKNTYHRQNLVTFGTAVIDIMSWNLSKDDTANNLRKAITDMNEFLAVWLTQDLWKEMTMDQFFTAVLLKGLHHEDSFRKELVTKTRKFMEEHKDIEDNVFVEGVTQVPTLRHALSLIEMELENRGFGKTDTVTQSRGQNQRQINSAGNNSMNRNGANRSGWQQSAKFREESAAAAGEFTGGGGDDPQHYKPKKQFDGPVRRSAEVKVFESNQNKLYAYLAVKRKHDICSKCWDENDRETKPGCGQKSHFQTKCDKCGYYGHKFITCQQKKDVNGANIEA
jgi:hypothetical protein